MKQHRTGVYVCACGTNIAKVVDCDEVVRAAEGIPGVAVATTYKYMCSTPGQEMIIADIQEKELDRVVVASCSPRMHEITFRKAVNKAGLNPYYLQMANIREQCSWVHEDGAEATQKAIDLVRAAVGRVILHEPLESRTVAMCPNTLVLGGGIAGLTASLELADAGYQVYLVEKADHLGGNLARVDLTAPYLDSAHDLLRERIHRVAGHPQIETFLGAGVKSLEGYVGNFTATVVLPGATVPGRPPEAVPIDLRGFSRLGA